MKSRKVNIVYIVAFAVLVSAPSVVFANDAHIRQTTASLRTQLMAYRDAMLGGKIPKTATVSGLNGRASWFVGLGAGIGLGQTTENGRVTRDIVISGSVTRGVKKWLGALPLVGVGIKETTYTTNKQDPHKSPIPVIESRETGGFGFGPGADLTEGNGRKGQKVEENTYLIGVGVNVSKTRGLNIKIPLPGSSASPMMKLVEQGFEFCRQAEEALNNPQFKTEFSYMYGRLNQTREILLKLHGIEKTSHWKAYEESKPFASVLGDAELASLKQKIVNPATTQNRTPRAVSQTTPRNNQPEADVLEEVKDEWLHYRVTGFGRPDLSRLNEYERLEFDAWRARP